MSEKFSPEQWKQKESTVKEAEEQSRQSKQDSRKLYVNTRMTKKERESFIGPLKPGNQRLLDSELRFSSEAERLIGDLNSPERDLVKLQQENLTKALKRQVRSEAKVKDLESEYISMSKGIYGAPSVEELERFEEIRKEIEAQQQLQEVILEESPEAFYGIHLRTLKKYSEAFFQKKKIIETPYVKKNIEKVTESLERMKPVLLRGHLGSGKTELAYHVARQYNNGQEPLVVRGRKHISASELYGHQILTVDEKTGTQTVTGFHEGPIYQAMREGRVVIIDEVNAIPHDLLISLNDILTKRIGKELSIQENSGSKVTIKEGFGIIMTANPSDKYIREKMDSAWLSRVDAIDYDYLPQKTDGDRTEADLGDELHSLLIGRLVDRNGGDMAVPNDTFYKIWNLSKAARVLQDVFSGKAIIKAFYLKGGGERLKAPNLEKLVLSLRNLDTIFEKWQSEHYRYELDYYIWTAFIDGSEVASDKAYTYQLLKDCFGFFKGPGWEQNPDYGKDGVVKSFDIKAPQNKPEKITFFGPRDIVEAVYGQPPERAKWPDTAPNIENNQDSFEVTAELEAFKEFGDQLDDVLTGLEKEIDQVCSVA